MWPYRSKPEIKKELPTVKNVGKTTMEIKLKDKVNNVDEYSWHFTGSWYEWSCLGDIKQGLLTSKDAALEFLKKQINFFEIAEDTYVPHSTIISIDLITVPYNVYLKKLK